MTKPLSEAEKDRIRRLYLAGMPKRAILYNLGRGQKIVNEYLQTMIFWGTLPSEQPPSSTMRAEEYEENGKTVKRFPPGFAEGLEPKLTARPKKDR